MHCVRTAKSKVGCFFENGLEKDEVRTTSVSLENMALHHFESSEAMMKRTFVDPVLYLPRYTSMADRMYLLESMVEIHIEIETVKSIHLVSIDYIVIFETANGCTLENFKDL